jgi:hypothetical protein
MDTFDYSEELPLPLSQPMISQKKISLRIRNEFVTTLEVSFEYLKTPTELNIFHVVKKVPKKDCL